MKTYSAKPTDIRRTWHLLDASEMTLGRLAVIAAGLLMGKAKPNFTPHIDGGDHVVVVNAKELKVSGNKKLQKVYYRHSGHPGGLKQRRLEEQLDKDATKVIEKAVRGMLPDNKLRAGRMARLKVYETAEHAHTAQKPAEYELSGDGK